MASSQMERKGKLEGEVQVRSSGDLFEVFARQPHEMSNTCPTQIQGFHVDNGGLLRNGAVVIWNYVLDGKPCIAKDRVENLDMVNKSLSYRVIEGDVLDSYKSMLVHLKVIPQGSNQLNIVRWTFEYEKLHEDVPPPTALLDFALRRIKQAEGKP